MSNPNPFVPKGSLLEQQSKRRSNLKIGVSCVLAVGIIGLLAMLIQGCKRDTTSDNTPTTTDQDTNVPAIQTDTNAPAIVDTNAPIVTAAARGDPTGDSGAGRKSCSRGNRGIGIRCGFG